MSAKKIENYTLWQKYKENDDQDARQEIIVSYLPLVKYQAGRIKMVVPGFIEEDDLKSYGIIGLIDAVHKFDYQQGIEFKTYASKRIRGEIIDHLRRLDWLPHSRRRDAKRLKKEADLLAGKLGRKPTVKELAERVEMSREQVDQLYFQIYSAQWVSLYNNSDESDEVSLISLVKEDSSQQPEHQFQQKEKVNLLADAIDRLKQTERIVVSLYYYEGLTQKEIAAAMELSPARVSQLHKKAIYRLRGVLSRKKEQFI